MRIIGKDVEDIWVWDGIEAFQTIITACLAGVVYVLHAVQKKTQITAICDIETAKGRFAQMKYEQEKTDGYTNVWTAIADSSEGAMNLPCAL